MKFRDSKPISRHDLASPCRDITYRERVIASSGADLKNNYVETDLGNGYFEIEPINTDKKVKE